MFTPPTQTLPAPHERMSDLDWFIGAWHIESKLLNEKDGVWIEETLSAQHTRELGDHLIFEHFYGPLGGEPYEAWSLRKLNSQTGKWEQRWVDTNPSGFSNWRGEWNAAARTYTGYAMRYIDDDGNLTGDTAMREIFDQNQPESFAWRLERTSDGGKTWSVIWQLDYRRIER